LEQAKKGLPHDRRMTLNDITNQQGGGAGRIVHTSFTKPVYGGNPKTRDMDVASVGCYQTTITLTNVTQVFFFIFFLRMKEEETD